MTTPKDAHVPGALDLPDVPSYSRDTLVIAGAREHNLKDITLTLPKRKLVVFTGPSGSGKSSLAFDTIYAEGRRRYVESLSTYARQFLGQMEKPDFDLISGLSPTISIEQKTTNNNPRSTVGTITEVHDHMRLLWAKLGVQHCHQCGREVTDMSQERIVELVQQLPFGTRFMILSPLVRNRKGEFRDLFEKVRKQGFARARIDGDIVELQDVGKLAKTYKHDIDIVVDRLVSMSDAAERIEDSVRLALDHGDGGCILLVPGTDGEEASERLLSTKRMCIHCDIAFPELTHQSFSFNSPVGMCPACKGLGYEEVIDAGMLIMDASKSLNQGVVEALGPVPTSEAGGKFPHKVGVKKVWQELRETAQKMDIDLDQPWSQKPQADQLYILHGSSKSPHKRSRGYAGLVRLLEKHLSKAPKQATRDFLDEFRARVQCASCKGERLRPESQAVRFQDVTIGQWGEQSIDAVRAQASQIRLEGVEQQIGGELLSEITQRLKFLENVGLQYLSLNRSADTLSGGESQRIRLASQLGSELSGILYVLDEPSIGLHQRDNQRLLGTLEELRDRGNSVLVVEHDRDTMEVADFIVDFGPGAGKHGGELVGVGTFAELCAKEGSLTGDYLAGRRTIEVPKTRRKGTGEALVIKGAREHNLKNVTLKIPKGCFLCVTGVSGAGKSTIVNDILYPAVARHVYFKHRTVGDHDGIEGLELFDKIIEIDQKPIGRTPRSNPATYTKLFDEIRNVYANLPEAKMYGFNKGRFSFNVAGGRCEECKGAGVQKVEMSFLADVYVPCDVCHGQRFNPPTLSVTYRGRSIAEVLDMSVADALELFGPHPKLRRVLQTLMDVGLDYVKLGQSSTTLSGGEAQRIKLSRELAKIATGDTLYILDEPSTGLHFEDIRKLLSVVDRLVDAGNTVVMIEHNIDLIKCADVVADMGPEGGDGGGKLVAYGTPEQVARSKGSHTGKFLKREFTGK